jgi:hypothetical protein
VRPTVTAASRRSAAAREILAFILDRVPARMVLTRLAGTGTGQAIFENSLIFNGLYQDCRRECPPNVMQISCLGRMLENWRAVHKSRNKGIAVLLFSPLSVHEQVKNDPRRANQRRSAADANAWASAAARLAPMPESRRFPPPWTVEETAPCFIVRDAERSPSARTNRDGVQPPRSPHLVASR